VCLQNWGLRDGWPGSKFWKGLRARREMEEFLSSRIEAAMCSGGSGTAADGSCTAADSPVSSLGKADSMANRLLAAKTEAGLHEAPEHSRQAPSICSQLHMHVCCAVVHAVHSCTCMHAVLVCRSVCPLCTPSAVLGTNVHSVMPCTTLATQPQTQQTSIVPDVVSCSWSLWWGRRACMMYMRE
jgi:hypothetical protein